MSRAATPSSRVLVTCPPMIQQIDRLADRLEAAGLEAHCPQLVQTLSEADLIDLLPDFDGWIIGDDPASRAVFAAGREGRLKAAVKWGVGTDNVDFAAAEEFAIPITHTPGMFGNEVGDVALAYVIGLARDLFLVDRQVRKGVWAKPSGMSLAGKTAGIVGYGDIGRNVARRLGACRMNLIVYDPGLDTSPTGASHARWPTRVEELDFMILACALTPHNRHMIDHELLFSVKPGLRIVNVARGPLIAEDALVAALEDGRVDSVALDVFEVEPLPMDSKLRRSDRCIFGSHNSSNTLDAVLRTSELAIAKLASFLNPVPG